MSEATEAEITEARGMGWIPKENYHGSAEWVDAPTFIKRGREILPIIQAREKRKDAEIASLREQLSQTTTALSETREAVEALKEFNSKANREKVQEKKEEIVTAIKAARQEGDVDAEVELQSQLVDTNAALKAAEKEPERKPNGNGEAKPVDYTQRPEWQAFVAENPWYGKDTRKTTVANGIAAELRADPANATLVGKPFFDKVAEEVERTLGGNPNRQRPSSVEGGRSTARENGERGRSYADLPADAKAACDGFAKRMIGANKAFKTADEWRKHYVEQYDWS